MKRIYLAGPINGCTYSECTDWRALVAAQFDPNEVETLDPMRAKDWLSGLPIMDNSNPDLEIDPLTSEKGIVARDFNDCTTSDLVIVNLQDAKLVSIGTCFELAWCYQLRIPTVVIPGELHDHPFVRQASSFTARTVAEAVAIAKAVLNL